MNKSRSIQAIRIRRAARTRAKLKGTAERPRLSVFRSNTQIYGQFIDDVAGKTLVSASTRELSKENKKKKKAEQAELLGALLAKKAKEKGIAKAIFDRGKYAFHGRVRACAEGARKEGLTI